MTDTTDRFVESYLGGQLDQLDFDASLAYARQAGGSGRRTAKLLGVADSTLSRWARGLTTPKPATRARVMSKVRGLRTSGYTGDDRTFTISVHSAEVRRRDRDRTITGAQLRFAPGTLDRAQAEWETSGDSEAAYHVFVEGIREPWYHAQFAALDASQFDDDMRGEETSSSDYTFYIAA
jgi:transcriptional regulator with XRE-family HTH domain